MSMPAAADILQPGITAEARSRRAFLGASALLWAASTATTVAWGASMSDMRLELPMPGGWTLSLAWLPMCGQTWFGAAISFVGMWTVMMVAMMLPSLTPVLWRCRLAAGEVAPALLAGLGYFFVWTLVGLAIFPLGATLSAASMEFPLLARAVPVAAGVVVLTAGILQFTAWKARQLACCGAVPGHRLPADAAAALRYGLRLGLHCCCACGGQTAVLLVLGVMDLRMMAIVTAAITAERLAPAGARVAQATGTVILAAGLLLIARASGLG